MLSLYPVCTKPSIHTVIYLLTVNSDCELECTVFPGVLEITVMKTCRCSHLPHAEFRIQSCLSNLNVSAPSPPARTHPHPRFLYKLCFLSTGQHNNYGWEGVLNFKSQKTRASCPLAAAVCVSVCAKRFLKTCKQEPSFH